MNDSTDNTNELDSYGVWVKHQPSADIDDAFDLPEFPNSDDTIDAIDASLDIPVEETLDLPNMDESFEVPESESVSEDSIEMPEIDGSIDIPEMEETFDIPAEEAITETADSETTEIDTSDFELPQEDGEISLDDFGFDDTGSSGGDDFQLPAEDGEISLDDFGFDDAGSSGGKTDEIEDEQPLDMDITFDSSAETIETVDNIQTDSVEYETEESAVEEQPETDSPSEEKHSTEITGGTEEIDLSDFGIDADAEETPIAQNIEESKLKDKIVDYDLSVSDENMASAPVVNEIKESYSEAQAEDAPAPAASQENVTAVNNSLLEQIVADLSGLKNELNNLKSDLEEMKSQEQQVLPSSEEPIIPESNTEDSGGFFDDTDGDDTIALSGNELDNIMNSAEFSEQPAVEESEIESDEVMDEPAIDDTFPETELDISEEPVIEETITDEITIDEPVIGETADDELTIEEPAAEETITDEITIDEPVIEETADDELIIEEPVNESEIEIPETTDEGGFFDNSDEDDTIALSGNELDNIMNNVEFSEETESSETSEDFFAAEEELDDDIPQEIDIEPIDTTDVIDDDIFGSVSDTGAEEYIEDPSDEFTETTDFIDNEENLEEPNLDDIEITTGDEEDDELPEEISIPKTDDILVESSNDDFMDSVKDTTPVENITEEIIEDAPVENITEEIIEDAPAEDIAEEIIEDAPAEDIAIDNEKIDDFDSFMQITLENDTISDSHLNYLSEEDDFPTVDSIIESETAEPQAATTEETVSEPAVDESMIIEPEPPVIEETSVDEPIMEEPELAPAPAPAPAPAAQEDDLKQDIKSVLLYMDQLLENLPEEKIVEFAKSDEFSTYKKLFNELGLS